MKKIRFLCGILISLILLSSCSTDETSIKNGFTLNGNFYETNFAMSSNGNPYYLIFYNSLNEDNPNLFEGQYGYFILISGEQIDAIPLLKGTYTTKNGPNSFFGIDGHHPIEFFGDSGEGNYVASEFWHQDEDFKYGTVTINSITSISEGLSNQVTEIDVDYTFQWDGITVKGNYNGKVTPN
ncbi:hypothetical protein [Snuella lapsa]|uniref:Lipoprotein n=1 Tax=Snuella lapsa TaxID=870481 RepID=A0ABP6YH49_9FLAO